MKLDSYRKIKHSLLILSLVFFAFSLFSVLHAETDEETSDPVKQRPEVLFLDNYHDTHMESLDCLSCHHDYEDGENILEVEAVEDGEAETACDACHDDSTTINLTDAYHQQCIGCHNKMKKKKETTGPSLCGECHIRPKE